MANLADALREMAEIGIVNARIDADAKRFINRAQQRICERRNWAFMHSIVDVTIPLGSIATAGSLVIGQNYVILAFAAGDDFTNVGALMNATGVRFTATGTTPTSWANGSSLQTGQSVNLPTNFKSVDEGNSPVTVVTQPYGVPLRVAIKTREQLTNRVGWGWWQQPNPPWNYPVRAIFLERLNGGPWTLNLPPGATTVQPITYQLSCFLYLPDLVLGSDTNALIQAGDGFDMVVNLAKSIGYAAEDPTDKRGLAALALYNAAYREFAHKDALQDTQGQQRRM